MSKHPLVRMYQLINSNDELVQLIKSKQKTQTDEPPIFTFKIPETYQKTEYAPFIRLTVINLGNAVYRDNDSNHYLFSFAVETFAKSISEAYEISQKIISIFKTIDSKCFAQDLSEDEEFSLYNNMLSFRVLLNEKEQ